MYIYTYSLYIYKMYIYLIYMIIYIYMSENGNCAI